MIYVKEVRLTGVRMSSVATLLGGSTQHIEAVTDGASFWTVPQVISLIDQRWRFYVQDAFGYDANVEVVHPPSGRPYIRTRRDNTARDNLLALPGGTLNLEYERSIHGLLAAGPK